MSAKYTFWAWGVKVKNAPLKLALLQLADNANDDGISWYSVPKMANRCDMSERALQGHIKELVQLGLLSIKERPGTSRVYQLQYQEAQLIAPQILHHTPAEVAPQPPQILHHTPAEVADDPNNEPNNIDPVIEKHSLPSCDDLNQMPVINEPKVRKANPVKGRRWKADEVVPDEWLEYAKTKGMALAFAKLEAEKFANYWVAASGAKAVKCDWMATWRNWVLSALDRAGASGHPVQQQIKAPREFSQ